MDSTVQALAQILLKAVPTFLLLLLLHFYLKAVFYKPLQQVLAKRREVTEGAREAADASLRQAADKASDYDAKLQRVRADIYREQEETRKKWLAEQSAKIEEARHRTHGLIGDARHQIATDVEAAKRELELTSGALASEIARSLVERKVQ